MGNIFLAWWGAGGSLQGPRSERRWEKDGKRGETSAVRLCLILISLLWLASLEMSRFTVINLLTHLTQQSVMEEAGVIRIEPPG